MAYNADYKEIGRRIELRRKDLGITLTELASEVDLSASTIQRYEKGSFERIKLPVIEAIADALNVNPGWLIGETDDPINYDDGDLLAQIPLSYIDACDGDMRKAYAMRCAVDQDVQYEQAVSQHKIGKTGEKTALLYSSEAMKLAKDYDGLDGHGQRVVRLVADEELARCIEQEQPAPSTTKLFIAARDGSRIEVDVDDDVTLPEEDSQLPR